MPKGVRPKPEHVVAAGDRGQGVLAQSPWPREFCLRPCISKCKAVPPGWGLPGDFELEAAVC